MRWLIVSIAAAFFLSSCASNKPSAEALESLSVPVNWTNANLVSADSSWWNEFHSSSLDSILKEAFVNNYSLQIAASNLKAAAAQATIQGADLFPQISADGSASRRKQNFIGLPIPGSEGGVLTTQNNTFGLNLSASWEIDLWGRLWKQRSAGVANFRAAEADYHGAQLSLMAQVSKSWFSTIESSRQVELAQATLEAFSNSYNRTIQRYEAGLTSSLDMRRARSNLASAEANLSQRKGIYDGLLRQLEVLLGRYPAAQLKTDKMLPQLQQTIPSGLPADLIMQRPDLLAAEQRLLAAKATTSSAKRALLPRISLTGSPGTISGRATTSKCQAIQKSGRNSAGQLSANCTQCICRS